MQDLHGDLGLSHVVRRFDVELLITECVSAYDSGGIKSLDRLDGLQKRAKLSVRAYNNIR